MSDEKKDNQADPQGCLVGAILVMSLVLMLLACLSFAEVKLSVGKPIKLLPGKETTQAVQKDSKPAKKDTKSSEKETKPVKKDTKSEEKDSKPAQKETKPVQTDKEVASVVKLDSDRPVETASADEPSKTTKTVHS